MRIFLGLFAVAALATSAFAVGELRALRHHEEVVLAQTEPVVGPADSAPVAAVPRPPLSTWRGTTPFGSVAAQPTDTSDVDFVEDGEDESDDANEPDHAILDRVDRCPEVLNGLAADDVDVDGCPDPEPTFESRRVIIRIDGVEREVLVRSQIRIQLNDIIY